MCNRPKRSIAISYKLIFKWQKRFDILFIKCSVLSVSLSLFFTVSLFLSFLSLRLFDSTYFIILLSLSFSVYLSFYTSICFLCVCLCRSLSICCVRLYMCVCECVCVGFFLPLYACLYLSLTHTQTHSLSLSASLSLPLCLFLFIYWAKAFIFGTIHSVLRFKLHSRFKLLPSFPW